VSFISSPNVQQVGWNISLAFFTAKRSSLLERHLPTLVTQLRYGGGFQNSQPFTHKSNTIVPTWHLIIKLCAKLHCWCSGILVWHVQS